MRVTSDSSAATHTVDCILFGYREEGLLVLLIRREPEPFAGHWVLPGGALDDRMTLEDTAVAVLREMAGVHEGYLQQVGTYSDPARHPVRRVITTAFYGLVRPEAHELLPGVDVREARWTPIDEAPQLGFDHALLLHDARRRLVYDVEHSTVIFRLLPERFTLTEVQQLHEAIVGTPVDRPNFRRKLLTYDFLIKTAKKRAGVRGGPALYRLDRERLAQV